jgi:hypothetical protein
LIPSPLLPAMLSRGCSSGNDFSGDGQGAQRYGKRFGASYADTFSDIMLRGAILPVLLHQDPRYFYKEPELCSRVPSMRLPLPSSARERTGAGSRTTLTVHQRLGLLTTIPLAATLFASAGAPCNRNCGPSAGADFHAVLGSVSVGMYAVTAYYAIAAPRVPGTEKKGAIRWHEALIWIHGPRYGPDADSGAMALSQQDNGQKVHGIAAAHSAVAVTTFAAYGASILAVSWPIHIKFREHQ